MSNLKDIASMNEEEMIPEVKKEKKAVPEAPIKASSEPVVRKDRQSIRFADGEVQHVSDYVKSLDFQDKVKLLFGRDLEEKEGEEGGEKDKLKLLKPVLGIAMIFGIVYIVVTGMGSLAKEPIAKAPSAETEIIAMDPEYFSETEWQSISTTVETEMSVYEMEELRKIRDYLDMRANRGSVMTSIKMQRSKKENTYFYLVQNRNYFRDNMAEYEDLEKSLIQSLSFSEQAINSFNENNAAAILRNLISR